jgi:hypothetical protein
LDWNSSHTIELELEVEVDRTWNDWFEKDEVEPKNEEQVLELEAEQLRVEVEIRVGVEFEFEVEVEEDFERNSDETLPAVDSRSGGRAGFFGGVGLDITCVVTFGSTDVGVV